MAASGFVSSIASGAVGAMGAMGAEVGLGVALQGVGVDAFLQRVQFMSLMGGLRSNLSNVYTNLAEAVEWTNFGVSG